MIFLYLLSIKYQFLFYIANKTIPCYTFSVRPIISASKNIKIATKKIDEEENEDFCEGEYFVLEALIIGEKKHFEKIFGLDGVSNTELKIDLRKIFVMISLSQNLKNSGFSLVFHPNLSYKNSCNF